MYVETDCYEVVKKLSGRNIISFRSSISAQQIRIATMLQNSFVNTVTTPILENVSRARTVQNILQTHKSSVEAICAKCCRQQRATYVST